MSCLTHFCNIHDWTCKFWLQKINQINSLKSNTASFVALSNRENMYNRTWITPPSWCELTVLPTEPGWCTMVGQSIGCDSRTNDYWKNSGTLNNNKSKQNLTRNNKSTKQNPHWGNKRAECQHEADEEPHPSSCTDTQTVTNVKIQDFYADWTQFES